MADPITPETMTPETFASEMVVRGLRSLVALEAPQLTPAQVDQVVTSRLTALPGVLSYRALPLAFVGDVIEPAHATDWLESAP
jgi:hypothetical protein